MMMLLLSVLGETKQVKLDIKTYNLFQDVLKDASSSTLKAFFQDDIEYTVIDYDQLIYYQFLATSIVGSASNRIGLSVHFWSNHAHHMIGKEKDLLERSKLDIFKEYLNIYSSKIKNHFSQVGLDLGVSLPLVSPGYQMFFLLNPGSYHEYFAWALENKSISIGFSCGVNFQDEKNFLKAATMPSKIKGLNDLEFL